MKKSVLIIALLSICSLGFSQEIRTIFSDNDSKTKSYGGYGGPLIRATQINNDWGLMIGGKGGVIINQKFGFGGIGMALVTDHTVIGNNGNGNANASLNLGYAGGGLFFEYIFNLASPVHFSIPLNVMAGGVSLSQNELEIESTGVFILEPGINLDFNFSENFILGLDFSYRQDFGSSLNNISNQDRSGINMGLVFKFGNF